MNHTYDRKNPRDLLSLYDEQVKAGKEVHLREIDFLRLAAFLDDEFGPDDALKAIESGIRRYRFSSRLYTNKAELLIIQGELDEALDALDRAEIFGQSFVKTDTIRARALLAMGNATEALALLHELRFVYHLTETQLSEVHFTEALVYERQQMYDGMFDSLRQSVTYSPFNESALQRLYLAMHLTGRYEESIILHEQVIDEHPYSHLAWFNLAQAYWSLDDYENAMDAFEYAFIANERFEPAYKEFVEVCFLLRFHDKALNAMEEVVNVIGDYDDEILLKIGQCHEYLGNTAQAKIQYYRALEIGSVLIDEIYFHIGECYRKEGKYSDSIYFYKRAIESNGLREDYHLSLASVYNSLGRYQKALPHYQKATELGPELADSWLAYGQFLMSLNGLEEAIEVIEEAELYTYSAELNYLKAAILFKLSRRKEGLDVLAEALQDAFHLQECFFDWLPEEREKKDVKAILRYFKAELQL